MLGNITGWHALILLAVILLLFGATRLPALARSVGQSARIFRSEVKTGKDAVEDGPSAATGAEPVALTSVPAAGTPVAAVVSDGAHGIR